MKTSCTKDPKELQGTNTQHHGISYTSLSYSAPKYCRCLSGKFISQSLNLLLPGVFPTPSSRQRKTISQDIQTPTPAFMLGFLQSPLFPVNHDYKPSPTFSQVNITHLCFWPRYLQQGKINTRRTKQFKGCWQINLEEVKSPPKPPFIQ